jgi:hypothetical protein
MKWSALIRVLIYVVLVVGLLAFWIRMSETIADVIAFLTEHL